jgi:uncharacterized membrane protein YoaK (UPF0700 family)
VEKSFTNSLVVAFLMAAIAGFTDVISFIGVNHLFTAHITGNIVIAISEIINHQSGVATKIIAIPIFILFAGMMTWIIEKLGEPLKLLAWWLFIEALLLAIFMYAGIYFLPHSSVGSWTFLIVSMLAVCAMAIHNTLLRIYMSHFPPCTVMTGNLTQFVVDSTTHLLRGQCNLGREKRSTRAGIKRYGNVLAGFLLGGLTAAFGFSWIGFWIIWLTIVILVSMAVVSNPIKNWIPRIKRGT